MRAIARPARCSCSAIRTARRGRPSSRSACPRTRPSGCRRRSSRRRTARRRNALVVADVAHVVWAVNLGCLGLHVWPSPRRRARARGRAADRPRPVRPGVDVRDGARGGGRDAGAAARARAWTGARRRRATAASTSTCGSTPEQDSYAVRSAAVAAGARARAAPARPGHGRVVEGGARRPRLHRLQPERAAQDGLRGLVGAGAGRRAGLDAVLLGRARDGRPGRADARDGARPGRGRTAIRGTTRSRRRSRWSRCSSCTSATCATG